MTQKKFNQILLFIISPFLFLPVTIYGLYKKQTFSLIFLVLTIGLFGYLYIPVNNEDVTRHYDRYIYLLDLSVNELTASLTTLADPFLSFYLFFMGKIGISFQIANTLLSLATVSIYFYIFNKTVDSNTNNKYFFCLLMIFFSFSLRGIFSGIRNSFAISMVLLAFYNSFFSKRNMVLSIFLLLFASLIHFSTLLFIPVYFCTVLLKDKPVIAKLFFAISFFFVFIPKEAIYKMISGTSVFGEAILYRLEAYLTKEDFVEKGMIENRSNIIIFYGSHIWLFFAYFYLLLTLKTKNSLLRTLLYCNIFFINFFYQAPTVFGRYALILKFLFALFFISEYMQTKKAGMLYIFCALFSFRFIFDLIICRYIILKSYFNSEAFLLLTALFKKITPLDWIPVI
jgi:hypothetical protein